MTAAIHVRNGIIDKFVGDGLMAFWTAPFSRGESHATDACLAALAQQRAIRELREHLSDVLGLRRDLPEFSVRMGLATGDLVVGTTPPAHSISRSLMTPTDRPHLLSLVARNHLYSHWKIPSQREQITE